MIISNLVRRSWKKFSAPFLFYVSKTRCPRRLYLQYSPLFSSLSTEVIIQESRTAFKVIVFLMLKTFP